MSAKYVVEAVFRFKHAKTGEPVESVGYWYGPGHGFGTTSGALDDFATATFTSRDQAERALRRVYGSVAAAGRRGYRVKRWDVVVIEEKNRRAARAAAREEASP